MNALQSIVGITAAVLGGDALWLTLRSDFHNKFFEGVQHAPLAVRWIPAIGVYALFVFALYHVAVKAAKTWHDAAWKGALVGGVMYGFYDFTNWATLRGWTAYMTVTDTAWGATAGAFGAAVGYSLLH